MTLTFPEIFLISISEAEVTVTTLKDFRTAPDEDILTEIESLLDPQRPNLGERLPYIAFYQQELTRRSVRDILKSSRRLEKLSVALIILSFALLALTIPPAIDAIMKLSGHAPARSPSTNTLPPKR